MRKSSTRPSARTAVNGAAADWIEIHAVDPAEVRAFCLRHGLFDDATWAVTLAIKSLRLHDLRVLLEGDPEGSDEWLVLEVDLHGSVDEVLAAYHRLKKKWLTHLPPNSRELMRLIYNIV